MSLDLVKDKEFWGKKYLYHRIEFTFLNFKFEMEPKSAEEECAYKNMSAKDWAESSLQFEEELKIVKDQLNIYKPVLLR